MSASEVSAADFSALADGDATLDGWRYLLGAIRVEYRAPSFLRAAEFVDAIAAAAEAAQHHPDLQLRYPGVVTVVLRTHATASLTELDVDLATKIGRLAADLDLAPSPVGTVVEIAIDTADAARIRPFWAAVLGAEERGGNLIDPTGQNPPLWFQQSDEPRTERGRFHIDVNVPHDQAEARVQAAVAAGGRVVTDEHARSWWVLADPDGNEACVCTWQDR